MSYLFTEAEQQILRDARELAPEGDLDPTGTGDWSAFYQAMSDIITSRIEDDTVTGADLQDLKNAKLWLDVAIGANRGTGIHSIFIRTFTDRQGELRRGSAFTDEEMQYASNGVALNLWNDLSENGWIVPSISEIAEADASSIGVNLFGAGAIGGSILDSNDTAITANAGWSGTLGFNLLGGMQPYESWRLLTGGDGGATTTASTNTLDDFKNILFAVDAYQFASKVSPEAILSGLNALLDLFGGGALDGIGDLEALIAQVEIFLANGDISLAVKAIAAGTPEIAPVVDLIVDLGVHQFLDMLIGATDGTTRLTETTPETFATNASTFFSSFDASTLQSMVSNLHLDTAALAILAKTDVNARVALAALSPVVVEVSSEVAAEFTLYDEATGEGKITEAWIDDRANFLSFFLENRRLGETPQSPVLGPDVVEFIDVASGLVIQVNDSINANHSKRIIFGDEGISPHIGGDNDDRIYGMGGNDIIDGKAGDDYIEGGEGDDTIGGGEGDDIIWGGKDNDRIVGGADNDELYGGAGEDTYVYTTGDGLDTIVDTDGKILFDNTELKGGVYDENLDKYVSQDGLYTYSLLGNDLVINDVITIKDYVNNNMGIELTGGINDLFYNFQVNDPSGNYANFASFNINPDYSYLVSSFTEDYGELRIDVDGRRTSQIVALRVEDAISADFPGSFGSTLSSPRVEYLGLVDSFDFKVEVIETEHITYTNSDRVTIEYYNKSTARLGAIPTSQEVISYIEDGTNFIIGTQSISFVTTPYNTNPPPVILAFDGNDSIVGTSGRDFITGLNGNDTIFSGGGNDSIQASYGDINIDAGTGDDLVLVNERFDYVSHMDPYTTVTNASVNLGDGNDYFGFSGDYFEVTGGHGNDTIGIGGVTVGGTFFTGEGYDIFRVQNNLTYVNTNITFNKDISKYSFHLVLSHSSNTTISENADKPDLLIVDVKIDYDPGNIMTPVGQSRMPYTHILVLDKDGENGVYIPLSGENIDAIIEEGLGLANVNFIFDDTSIGLSEIRNIILENSTHGSDDDDVINGTETDDELFGYLGNDELNGFEGDDSLQGGDGDDLLNGGDGNDLIYGGDGNDTLQGGKGSDDYLEGGKGNDTYLYAVGDGNTTIKNYDGDLERNDVLRFLAGILPTDVAIIKDSSDLKLSINTTGTTITVQSYFDYNYADRYALNAIEFNDGTIWDFETVQAVVLQAQASENNDNINGSESDDTLNGLGGNDRIEGRDGNDTLNGGSGSDTLLGGSGNDSLYGGAGTDYDLLYGEEGDDTLQRGGYLVGGSGSDSYLFAAGDGNTNIDNYDDSNGRWDILRFLADILPGDVIASRFEQSLHLTLKSTSEVIRVSNYFDNDGDNSYYLNAIEFTDGTSWDVEIVKGLVQQGSGDNDTLYGYESDDLLDGLGGNDTLYGQGGNDTLNGGDGNDFLYGHSGNDQLYGEAGDDNYRYSIADGNDVIEDSEGLNTLTLSGINQADVSISRSENDLLITINETSEFITLSNWFEAPNYRMEVSFSNDTLTPEEIELLLPDVSLNIIGTDGDDIIFGGALDDELYGLGGNDTIEGGADNDLINGGAGNDILFGGAGSDLYIYQSGDGNDEINEDDSTVGNIDTIRFVGMNSTDIQVNRGTGNQLFVTTKATNEILQVSAWFNGSQYQTELIEFANGEIWDVAQIEEAVALNLNGSLRSDLILAGDQVNNINAGSGDDQIFGGALADTIDAGDGDDFVFARSGDNKIVGGAGNDEIHADDGDDIISGNEGDDIIFTGIGNNQISGGTGNDTIYADAGNDTISGDEGDDSIYAGSGDNVVEGGEGNDKIYVNGGVNILNGGTGNDEIYAGSDSDTIDAGSGDDKIYGQAGDDHIMGGDGNDYIIGGDGDDLLEGGSGSDLYIYGAGHGNDILLEEQIAAIDSNRVNLFNLNPSDVSFSANESGDLIMQILASSEMLTIKNWFSDVATGLVNSPAPIAAFEFSDSSVMSAADITLITELPEMEIPEQIFNGTSGNDIINGTAESETINGFDGDDTINGGLGADALNGGAGIDTATYIDSTSAVTVNLLSGTASGGDAEGDTLVSIENLIGSDVATERDRLTGDDGDNHLKGMDGKDYLEGGAGADTIDGGAEWDYSIYQNSDAGIDIDLDRATQIGGHAQGDVLTNIEAIIGSNYDDSLRGNYKNDFLKGQGGNDVLFGEGGNDKLYGEFGDDTLEGGAGADALNGGSGVDTASYISSLLAVDVNLLSGSASGGDADGDTLVSIENLIGSDVTTERDRLTGNDGDNHLQGLAGDDFLDGGSGNDTYHYSLGNGNDIITETSGIDSLYLNGINQADVSFSQSVDDLLVTTTTNNQTITIKDWFASTDKQVETILLADAILDTNQVEALIPSSNTPPEAPEVDNLNVTQGQILEDFELPAFTDNGPLTYELSYDGSTNLPVGLMFNPETHTLSGEVIGSGEYHLTLTATDSDATSSSVTFTLIAAVDATHSSALGITLSVDDAEETYFNGTLLGSSNQANAWRTASNFVVNRQEGINVLSVKATDTGGVAGLIAQLQADGQTLYSNGTWKVSTTYQEGWQDADFDDSAWVDATAHGVYGDTPWLKRVSGLDNASQANWIWSSDNAADNQVYFRYVLDYSQSTEINVTEFSSAVSELTNYTGENEESNADLFEGGASNSKSVDLGFVNDFDDEILVSEVISNLQNNYLLTEKSWRGLSNYLVVIKDSSAIALQKVDSLDDETDLNFALLNQAMNAFENDDSDDVYLPTSGFKRSYIASENEFIA